MKFFDLMLIAVGSFFVGLALFDTSSASYIRSLGFALGMFVVFVGLFNFIEDIVNK